MRSEGAFAYGKVTFWLPLNVPPVNLPDTFNVTALPDTPAEVAVYQASSSSIALPHSSQVQATMGTEVDTGTGLQVLNDGLLQPGDLIAFYNLDDDDSYDHIGIYIGNGDMIDAPETGQYGRVDNLATTYWEGGTWQVRSFG